MKILVVAGTHAPETGGIAAVVRGLAGGLVACGAEVRILASTPGAARFSTPKLPVVEFALPARGFLRRVAACRRAAAAALRGFAADRILASSWSPFAIALPVSSGGRALALDVLCHGMDLFEPARSARYRALMRRSLARASKVLANSRFTAEAARAFGARAGSVAVLHPGVDPERFTPGPRDAALLARHGIAPSAPVVLSVGRVIERKGFDLVLRALPDVLRKHGGTVYLVAGDGPDRARLERLAASLRMADRVRFAGEIADEDLPRYYRSADVFAMPARHREADGDVEGFGIVFLEAACAELPSIAGRAGGMPDAVEHGETGYLIDPARADECASRIVALLDDPELRRRLGAAGRRRAASRFTWPAIARRYLSEVGGGAR